MKLSLRILLTFCLAVTVLIGAGHLVLLQFDHPENQNSSGIIIHRFKRSRPASDAATPSRRRRGRSSGRFKASTYRPPSPVIQALQFDKIDIFKHYEAGSQSTSTAPSPTDAHDRALPIAAELKLIKEEEDEALYLTELQFQPDHHVSSDENNQDAAASRSTVIPNIAPSDWKEEARNDQPFQADDVVWAPHLTQPPEPAQTTHRSTNSAEDVHFEEAKDVDFYRPKHSYSATARKHKQRPRYGGAYGPPPYHGHGGGYHRPVVVHPPPIIVDKDKGYALKAFLLVFLIPLAIALALFVLFALAIGYAYTLAYVATILNSTNITYVYGLSGFSVLPYFTSLASSAFTSATVQQQQQQQQQNNNNNNNNNNNGNNNNNAMVINVTGRANQDDEMLIFKNPFKFSNFKEDEDGELMDDY